MRRIIFVTLDNITNIERIFDKKKRPEASVANYFKKLCVKLPAYVPRMRLVLAEVMGTAVGNVSIKATTTERLGFVGRKEGCEVWAIAMICKK